MGLGTVSFKIPGRVGGKGRPRFTVVDGQPRAFTPAKTRSTEAMVRDFAEQAMGGSPLLEGAVQVSIQVNLERPKSWTRKKIDANPFPTGKPDLDNVVKLIGDALNGVVWRDDSQISELYVSRNFTSGGESTEVCIRPLSPMEVVRGA